MKKDSKRWNMQQMKPTTIQFGLELEQFLQFHEVFLNHNQLEP